MVREHTGSCGNQLSCEGGSGSLAPLLRIGAVSGVKNLDGMPTWCLQIDALAARSVHMRAASSTANVGL